MIAKIFILYLLSSLANVWIGLGCAGIYAHNITASLIRLQRGTLPILLTAPHGGKQPLPNAPLRTRGIFKADLQTAEFTEKVNQRIEELTDHRPYVIIADFHRKYLDVNRAEEEAFDKIIDNAENTCAQTTYQEYHASIRRFINEIKTKYSHALLIDIHGHGGVKNTIYRGTCNLKTVQKLIAHRGQNSLLGHAGLFAILRDHGYEVPPPGAQPEEKFTGGYTVQTYGSHHEDGIDAIQLELSKNLRFEHADQCARDLATAIVQFAQKNLEN